MDNDIIQVIIESVPDCSAWLDPSSSLTRSPGVRIHGRVGKLLVHPTSPFLFHHRHATEQGGFHLLVLRWEPSSELMIAPEVINMTCQHPSPPIVVRTLNAGAGGVTHPMAISASGDIFIFSCGYLDHWAEIWDTSSHDPDRWNKLHTLKGEGGKRSVAVSQCGQRAITHCSRGYEMWDCSTGHEMHRIEHRICFAAFSPVGRLLACLCPDGQVSLRSVATGDEVATLIHSTFPSPNGCIAFNHDGSILAWSSAAAGISFWNMSTLTCVSQIACKVDAPYWVDTISFSRDGQFVITSSSEQKVEIRRVPAADESETGASSTLLGPTRVLIADKVRGGGAVFMSLDGRYISCLVLDDETQTLAYRCFSCSR